MQSDLPRTILTLLDLTGLNDSDTEITIADLCKKAVTPYGHVAAVCIYPQFVSQAKNLLRETAVKIATVANFPAGTDSEKDVIASIQKSIQSGANEIDVVFPYQDYLEGKVDEARQFIKACKTTCGEDIILKVILETGAFKDTDHIADASRDILLAGADFLKTSTGKIPTGATIPAATAMIMTIKQMSSQINHPLGFKAAGGIRTIEQASQYINLATEMMGPNWVQPQTFRIGASQLMDAVIAILSSQ